MKKNAAVVVVARFFGMTRQRNKAQNNSSVFSFLRRLFDGPEGISEDKRARRNYVAGGALMGIVVQVFFLVVNLFYNITLELIFDVTSVFAWGWVLVLLRHPQRELVAYRVGIATIIFICVYTVAFPNFGLEGSLLSFYVVPAALFYVLGWKEGLKWVVFFMAPAALFSIAPEIIGQEPLPSLRVLRFLASLVLFTGFSAMIEWYRARTWRELNAADTALRTATGQLITLEGLVPVCSYCKKIRNDKGYWQQLEEFLRQHTNAHVSSGICESCAAQKKDCAPSGGFPVPAALQRLFSWRTTLDTTKRKFVTFAGLVGIFIVWSFVARDIAQGKIKESIAQVAMTIVVGVIIWFQHIGWKIQLSYAVLVVILMALVVVPYFFPNPDLSEMFWFYIVPLFSSYLLGNRVAAFSSFILLVIAGALFANATLLGNAVAIDTILFFGITFVLVSILALYMEHLRVHYTRKLVRRLEMLEKTYSSIRAVKGLVPVCKECKSVRNDQGFWTNFDSYIKEHSDLQFSHGICETCLEREAPDVFAEMQAETNS